MKTLAVILHYNTLDLTNSLYASLAPYQKDYYDLLVLDNGSEEAHISEYPSLYTNKNLFFGGGLNWAFSYVLQRPEYDSLLLLNSDLILDGKDFVKTLRDELFQNNFKIISPSIIKEAGTPGCKWRQMSNHGSNGSRDVRWIDFQCPMFHTDFIKHVKAFDEDLKYGWGQDSYSGLICEDNGWGIGVTDKVGVEHLDSVTEKRTKGIGKFRSLQMAGMNHFMKKNNIEDQDQQLRAWAKNYKAS
jgi:hypothetical protein